MLYALNKTIPHRPEFRHFEGNTTAHVKASLMGSSVTVIIESKNPLLAHGRYISVNLTAKTEISL